MTVDCLSRDHPLRLDTSISCCCGCDTMSFPVNRLADPAFRQLPFGTVNRESEFTHMRTGPVGYHNNDALVGINM